MITINPVLGSCSYKEIPVKINIAYNMYFWQNGVELEGINGMTLPDLNDLYIIKCEMTCKLHIWRGYLHIWFTAFAIAYLMIIAKNDIVRASVKCGISYIARIHFSCRFWIWSQNSKILSVSHVIVQKYVMKDWSHCRRYFKC